MLTAAASGRLDYKDADSNDIVWLLRERTMLGCVERESLIELTKRRQLQQITTSCPSGDAEGKVWAEHYEDGRKQLELLGKLMFPWLSWDKKEHYRSEIAELREEYKQKFGDPGSPEAKEQDKRNLAAIKRRQLDATQNAKESSNREKDVAERIRAIRARRHQRS